MKLEALKDALGYIGCSLVEKKCYDAQSGWTGTDMYVNQISTGLYLHKNGKFEDKDIQYNTYNVSINGYIHTSAQYDEAYDYIKSAVNGTAVDLLLRQKLSSPASCLSIIYDAVPSDKKQDTEVRMAYDILREFVKGK